MNSQDRWPAHDEIFSEGPPSGLIVKRFVGLWNRGYHSSPLKERGRNLWSSSRGKVRQGLIKFDLVFIPVLFPECVTVKCTRGFWVWCLARLELSVCMVFVL